MKKIIIGTIVLLFSIVSVCALSNNFSINSSKLSLFSNNKKDSVLDNFNDNYELSHSISSTDVKEEEIIKLTKKMTYLLLGDFNNYNESSEEYYKRHQEYLSMGAHRTYPKDENSQSGYDESNQNYSFAVISAFTLPSLFLKFDEIEVIYNSYGDIRITNLDSLDLVISSITLPKVKIKEENDYDPSKYDIVETNLMITYYFLKINDEYKLCYLYGETGEAFEEYFTSLENTENKSTMQAAMPYDSELKNLYNYSKLDMVTEEQTNSIYNSNKNNIVILNSYYNNYSVGTANGFFINNGLIITTWNFLEKALTEAQYIAIKDSNGISYSIDGIVTANPETDIAVIKLKENINRKVNLGSSEELKIEDPIFIISSKRGVGLTLQKGIIIANDGYIQSAIPLSNTDEGSPLLDKNGNVVGINTAKQINTSISLAVNSNVLKEVQNKFNNIDFEMIETISFNELKEKYYYIKYNDEVVANNISKRKWKEYSKIGNIEENIKLELVKASYKDGVVSLRYQNGISDFISSMQLSSSFREQLIKDGYKEVLKGNKKYIYENKKYQVIVMDEFDYLIVVMVKL